MNELKNRIELINCNISCNDKSIPKRDRIYSPNKKYWCKKTTKVSADLLIKNIEQMKSGTKQAVPSKDDIIKQIKRDTEKQGLKSAILPKEDWHIKCARALPLKNHPTFWIDVHYIFDEEIGKYRMYTDDTKYGERMEIIFDNEKQCFTIKNLDKLRKKWNETHKDEVKRDIDRDFDEFLKEKF
jgi:hypothetical protein